MCLHIFSPGKKIQIDYAAESITLVNGGSQDLFDILVTNHSAEPIHRLHIIYPHAVAARDSPDSTGPAFWDLTETWLDKGSVYNSFYGTPETLLEVKHGDGHAEVTVTLIDPTDVQRSLPYRGVIRSPQTLTPYQISEGEKLDEDEWDVLASLGWSVFTLGFRAPMVPGEPRWLRLRGDTGTLGTNTYSALERYLRKMCNFLIHRFEIAGPVDVRHRLASVVRAGATYLPQTAEARFSLLKLQALQDKILRLGLEVPGTETVVMDWRINLFSEKYRRCDVPISWGDIRPCGGLINRVTSRTGRVLQAYQWKAGKRNVSPEMSNGFFEARIQAHDVSIFVLVLPWISLSFAVLAFLLSLFALVSRPDILGRLGS